MCVSALERKELEREVKPPAQMRLGGQQNSLIKRRAPPNIAFQRALAATSRLM